MYIKYKFILPYKKEELIELLFDNESLLLLNDIPDKPPYWTALDFGQCPKCTLSIENYPHCPIAVQYVELLPAFENLLPHEEAKVNIFTNKRIFSKNVSVKKAVSSLLGLIHATSGCPHMVYLRPMARFHLPFADLYETTYRVASMYLLAQYFRQKAGNIMDLEFDGLKDIYSNLEMIDQGMIERLQVVIKKETILNALTNLYGLAKLIPISIESSFGVIQHLFEPYTDLITKAKRQH